MWRDVNLFPEASCICKSKIFIYSFIYFFNLYQCSPNGIQVLLKQEHNVVTCTVALAQVSNYSVTVLQW